MLQQVIADEPYLHGSRVTSNTSKVLPVKTVSTSTIGICGTADKADSSKFPLNTPILIDVTENLPDLGIEGTLPLHLKVIRKQIKVPIVFVRVDGSGTPDEVLAKVAGQDQDGLTGVHCFRAAETQVGEKPRLLIAPGFTHQIVKDPKPDDKKLKAFSKKVLNPVIASLTLIANDTGATAILDCLAKNLKEAKAYREQFNSRDSYITHSRVGQLELVNDSFEMIYSYSSAITAAAFAINDVVNGFWSSPSNKVIKNIDKIEIDVGWANGDINCFANKLNEIDINTFVRYNREFHLWGTRSASDKDKDIQYWFINKVRLKKAFDETVQKTHLHFIDLNIDTDFFDAITTTIGLYIDRLKDQKAIKDGYFEPDDSKNTPDAEAEGKAYFNSKLIGFSPAETITTNSVLTKTLGAAK